MCFDVKTKLESQLRRAKHKNDATWIKELETLLHPYWKGDLFHASGFSHPDLFIYTNQKPFEPTLAKWGLIPAWVKNPLQKEKIWSNTINARCESIFEKPSFRDSAVHKRGLIQIDGFYEHHHENGKTYPYFIKQKSNEPMTLATLWDEWLDSQSGEIIKSFTIVTTKANPLMAKIHNNPKLDEPRMPVIFTDEMAEEWLNPKLTQKDIQNLCLPFPEDELDAYTVRPIRGKLAVGNKPEASDEFIYEELVQKTGKLF